MIVNPIQISEDCFEVACIAVEYLHSHVTDANPTAQNARVDSTAAGRT